MWFRLWIDKRDAVGDQSIDRIVISLREKLGRANLIRRLVKNFMQELMDINHIALRASCCFSEILEVNGLCEIEFGRCSAPLACGSS